MRYACLQTRDDLKKCGAILLYFCANLRMHPSRGAARGCEQDRGLACLNNVDVFAKKSRTTTSPFKSLRESWAISMPRPPSKTPSMHPNKCTRNLAWAGDRAGWDCHPRDLHAEGVLRQRLGEGHLRPQADQWERLPLPRARGVSPGKEPELRQGAAKLVRRNAAKWRSIFVSCLGHLILLPSSFLPATATF